MRVAEEKDLPRIVEIYNSTIPTRSATADTTPVTVEDKTVWYKSHYPSSRPLYVEEQGGEVIGWMSFQDFYGRPAYSQTAELSIYVDEKFRGRGVGMRMLKYAIDMAPQLNIQNIISFIFAHNQASLALLAKCGFKSWGLLPDIAEMDNKKYSVVIYGLKVRRKSEGK